MKKMYKALALLFSLVGIFSTAYATDVGSIDTFTTKEITPWMKKYYMTSENQYNRGYKGGEGWQKIKCMSADPFDVNNAVFGTDTSGIWTTADMGKSWNNTSSGFNSFGVLDVDYDPMRRNLLYAVGYPGYSSDTNIACELYMSEDGGMTWKSILDNFKVEEAQAKRNILAFGKTSKDFSDIYLCLYEGGIIRSEDMGKTWNSIGLDEYNLISIELCGDTMYALSQKDGIFLSRDFGRSFQKLKTEVTLSGENSITTISPEDILDIAVNPTDGGNIVFITKEYCISSADFGNTWEHLSNMSKRWDRQLSRVLYAPPDKNGVSALYVTGGLENLRYSTDGGKSRIVSDTDTSLHYNPEEGWYQNLIAVSAQNPDIVYAASAFEVAISTDRGANFIASSSGYSGMRAVDFAFSPRDDYEYYFSFIDTAIAGSDYKNQGEEYPLMTYLGRDSSGIRYNKYKTSQAIAIDPKNPDRIIFSVGVDDNTIIKESPDKGQTFRQFNGTVGACHEIAFHSQKPDTIYAGRYISHDDGKTWTDCGYEIRAVSPVNSDIIYGVSGGLCKSSDGGKSWSGVITGVGGGNIKIVADLFDEDKLYICDYESGYKVYDNGILTDADPGFICWVIAQNPENAKHLVAGGTDSVNKRPARGIYESYDGGENWHLVTGLTGSCDVWGMAFHPRLARVFIGTSSGTFIYEYEKFKEGEMVTTKDTDGNTFVHNARDNIGVFDMITAEYKDGAFLGATVRKKELAPFDSLTAHMPKAEMISPEYAVKHQSSDGKMWKIGEGDNYNLLQRDGKEYDTLYFSMSLGGLSGKVKKAYIITSTTAGEGLGNNSWTKFSIEECSDVSAKTLEQGKVPEKLPDVGAVIAEDVFSNIEIKKNHYLYDFVENNLIVNKNSFGNYMCFDITEYVNKKFSDGGEEMSFRLRLTPKGEQDYSFAINNAMPKLVVEYEELPERETEYKLFLWDSISGMKAVSQMSVLK